MKSRLDCLFVKKKKNLQRIKNYQDVYFQNLLVVSTFLFSLFSTCMLIVWLQNIREEGIKIQSYFIIIKK
jgi:hypothetical protein